MYKTFAKVVVCLVSLWAINSTQPAFSQNPTVFDVETTTSEYSIVKSIPLPGSKIAVIGRNSSQEVYLSIYNAAGFRLSHTNISGRFSWPHTNRDNVDINAVSTADGKLFISYNINSNSAGVVTYNARYILLEEDGDLVNSGQLNSVDAAGSYTWFIELDRLSDGKIVAVWRRAANTNIVFRLFKADGTPFNNDQAFAGAGTTTPFTSIYTVKLAAGRNGNFMVSIYAWNNAMRGFVFNNNGTTAAAGGALSFSIDATAVNNYDNLGICALANGNFALSWWLNYALYAKIVTADGTTVVAKHALASSNVQFLLPDYTAGNEGYIIAEYMPRTPNSSGDPNATLRLHKYNQQGLLNTSTFLTEGYLIQPSYQFIAGPTGGLGYLYSYYKTYSVIEDDMGMGMDMAFPEGDMDTKAALVGFSFSTLPVELLSFTATLREDNQVELQWSTSSESNNRYFEIAKSTDGINFNVIAKVDGAGSSSDKKDYSYTDPQQLTQKSFYRLRQVDIDGRLKNLGVKMLSPVRSAAKVSVYPNPLQGSVLTMDAGSEKLPVAWQLIDAAGRTINSGKLTQQREDINTGELTPGIYFVRIGNEVIKLRK